MKTLIFPLFFFTCVGLSAQEVIATQGASFSNAELSLDWTIGEMVIETYSDSNFQLTQGFHQPQLMITAIVEIPEDFSVRVFPNPTSEFINLSIEISQKGLYCQFFDLNGKLLLEKNLNDSLNTISTNDLSSGTYFLVIKDQQQKKLKTYKVQKL